MAANARNPQINLLQQDVRAVDAVLELDCVESRSRIIPIADDPVLAISTAKQIIIVAQSTIQQIIAAAAI